MTKLDDIFSKFSQRGDAVTVVWTDARLVADIKQDIKRLMLELVGEDEQTESKRSHRDPEANGANDLRAELRRKVEAL